MLKMNKIINFAVANLIIILQNAYFIKFNADLF